LHEASSTSSFPGSQLIQVALFSRLSWGMVRKVASTSFYPGSQLSQVAAALPWLLWLSLLSWGLVHDAASRSSCPGRQLSQVATAASQPAKRVARKTTMLMGATSCIGTS
jgi:hypothetical protein